MSVSSPRTGMRCAMVMIVVSPRKVQVPSFWRGRSGSEAGLPSSPVTRTSPALASTMSAPSTVSCDQP